MKSVERFVCDITVNDRKVLEKLLGYKLQMRQSVIVQVKDLDALKKNGGDSLNCEPSATPNDWDNYSDMIGKEAVKAKSELEAIIRDWAISSNASDEEVTEVRMLLLEHPHLLDFDI